MTYDPTSRAVAIQPIYDAEGAAQLLRCSVRTIEDRLRTGDLPGEKFGDGWILPGQALIDRVNEIAVAKAAERRQAAAMPAPLTKPVRQRRRVVRAFPGFVSQQAG